MKKIKLTEQDLIKLIQRVLNEAEEAPAALPADSKYETNMDRLQRQNPETASYVEAMQKAQQQHGSNYTTWLQTAAEPKQVVRLGAGYSSDNERAALDSRRPASPSNVK